MSAPKRGKKAVKVGDMVEVSSRHWGDEFLESRWKGRVTRVENDVVWVERSQKDKGRAGVQPVSYDRLM